MPPVITSLSYAQSGGVHTVNGTVLDEDLSSVAVSLSSNIEGVGGQSPSVGSDGSFCLIVSVSTHVTGSIGAIATDCWGLTSDLVSVTVS